MAKQITPDMARRTAMMLLRCQKLQILHEFHTKVPAHSLRGTGQRIQCDGLVIGIKQAIKLSTISLHTLGERT